MATIQIKFKKLSDDAVLPTKAKPGDAGLDLTAVSREIVMVKTKVIIDEPSVGNAGDIDPIPESELDGVKRPQRVAKDTEDDIEHYIRYKFDLAVEIPEGFVGLIFPRSSISKKDLVLANSVGVIDSGYRGPIEVRFKFIGNDKYHAIYKAGERVAQLIVMPIPEVKVVEVDELSDTERSDGGFGSTGS